MTAVPLSPFRTAAGLIFISGQVGLDPQTAAVPTQFNDEIGLAFAALDRALGEAELRREDVVRTTVYLTDGALFPAMNARYADYFAVPYPARTTLISGLALPGLRFEIDAIAATRA